MGSLHSPRRPATPPNPSSEFSSSMYRVYALFCNRGVSNWIERYDPSTNTWSHVSPIPGLGDRQVLKGCSMVTLGDSIYVIGGLRRREEGETHCADESEEFIDVSEEEVLSSVLCYNVRLDQWSERSPLDAPRYDFACAVCEQRIYVAGGKSSLTSARGNSSAEVYDPSTNVWTPLPNMSILRYKCVGVTWRGKFHVVGGFAARVDSDTMPSMTERSSAEVLDTQAGKWDLVAGMWQLDVPPNQIVDVDGKLFSSGDCFKPWKGHVEAYDGKLNIWNVVDGSHSQTLDSPNSTSESWSPIQRLYLTMAPIGPHLYFLAGYRMAGEPPRTMSMVHVFDTSANRHAWRSMEPIEEEVEKELCSHCCVAQTS